MSLAVGKGNLARAFPLPPPQTALKLQLAHGPLAWDGSFARELFDATVVRAPSKEATNMAYKYAVGQGHLAALPFTKTMQPKIALRGLGPADSSADLSHRPLLFCTRNISNQPESVQARLQENGGIHQEVA